MPSGPSRCELGQSAQAQTHPCRASGTEAGKQSRQGVQVADLLGYVPGAIDQNRRVEGSTWPSQTDVKCRHSVSGGASAYRFARFLNSSRL